MCSFSERAVPHEKTHAVPVRRALADPLTGAETTYGRELSQTDLTGPSTTTALWFQGPAHHCIETGFQRFRSDLTRPFCRKFSRRAAALARPVRRPEYAANGVRSGCPARPSARSPDQVYRKSRTVGQERRSEPTAGPLRPTACLAAAVRHRNPARSPIAADRPRWPGRAFPSTGDALPSAHPEAPPREWRGRPHPTRAPKAAIRATLREPPPCGRTPSAWERSTGRTSSAHRRNRRSAPRLAVFLPRIVRRNRARHPTRHCFHRPNP